MVNCEYPPLGGGGGVALKHLVREIGEFHEVTVLTSGARGLPKIEKEGATVVHRARRLGRPGRRVASLASTFSFLSAGLLRGWNILREERYDLINTWFAIPSGPTGVWLSRMFKIPHVLTLIGTDVYDPSKRCSPHRSIIKRAIVRWAMDSSKWCTAWSSDVRDRARTLFRREIAIDVVPPGIARPEYRPVARLVLGMERDAFYCVTVGRLIHRKRVGLLLDVFARSSDTNLKLLIIGEGPEEKSLRRRVKALGLEKRVELLGRLPDEKKFQYLSNCDAYVSVSSHEGFGLTFVEAMACGLPVLAPAIGGQRDWLIHGESGLVLEPDGDDLLRRIDELLDAPEKAVAMREFNRRYAEKFSVAYVAELWAETFERYLKSMY